MAGDSRSTGVYGALGSVWATLSTRAAIGPAWLRKAVGWALLAGFLYWIPTYYPESVVTALTKTVCLAIAALGLNLLTGYTGQISVGHGAFFGIGAYTLTILVTDHGWGYPAAMVVAAALSFVVGVIVGLPALRIKGLYLALVTLGLASLFPLAVKRFSDLTGGSQGKRLRPPLRPPEGSGLANDQFIYYVTIAVAVVCFVLVRNLVRSRVGRSLIAIRDNETAAATMGVNITRTKLAVFGVSAMLAGIGGALSVLDSRFVNAGSYQIDRSIEILVAVVIGGVASIAGPILGAVAVVFVPDRLPENLAVWKPVMFAALLIGLVFLAPGGIMGMFKRIGGEARVALARRAAADDGDTSA